MMKKFIFFILCGITLGVFGMTPEARRSYEQFEQRAEGGDSAAQYRLSALLENGFDSIPADTLRSVLLLRRSAASGYAPALNYLGYLFQHGRFVRADRDSAFYYIKKAADKGDPLASHNLAFLLLDNVGVQYSDSTAALALKYLRFAADAGLPQSQTLLADLLSGQSEVSGLETDTVMAVNLYEKAIRQGFKDAELRLLNLMGRRWMNLDSQSALEEAVRYWNMGAPTISVELLHLIGPMEQQTARAYALLGNAYSRGQGASYDHRKANEYFARAAILGNPSAQFILAETLEIFPDALKDLLPELPDSLSPESLRSSAAKAGINTAEQASRALFSID